MVRREDAETEFLPVFFLVVFRFSPSNLRRKSFFLLPKYNYEIIIADLRNLLLA